MLDFSQQKGYKWLTASPLGLKKLEALSQVGIIIQQLWTWYGITACLSLKWEKMVVKEI